MTQSIETTPTDPFDDEPPEEFCDVCGGLLGVLGGCYCDDCLTCNGFGQLHDLFGYCEPKECPDCCGSGKA